jgi:hypothetical protein
MFHLSNALKIRMNSGIKNCMTNHLKLLRSKITDRNERLKARVYQAHNMSSLSIDYWFVYMDFLRFVLRGGKLLKSLCMSNKTTVLGFLYEFWYQNHPSNTVYENISYTLRQWEDIYF